MLSFIYRDEQRNKSFICQKYGEEYGFVETNHLFNQIRVFSFNIYLIMNHFVIFLIYVIIKFFHVFVNVDRKNNNIKIIRYLNIKKSWKILNSFLTLISYLVELAL